MVKAVHLVFIVCVTVMLHTLWAMFGGHMLPVSQRLPTTAPSVAVTTAAAPIVLPHPGKAVASEVRAVGGQPRMLIATATQPAPCTTAHGDHVIQLSLKNKLQYATHHGYAVWPSTELLSPWDLGGQWNKVALLSVLMDPGGHEGVGAAYNGEWIMWMDDDAIFCDMRFKFPFEAYDAAGVDLVMWGDDKMTYVEGNSEGINTGTMLLRVSDWTRDLLTAWADVASSALREHLSNADQGGLVHLLHTQPDRWRRKTLLERNFTMNGHWPDYTGRLVRGSRSLKASVWGSSAPPFIIHYSGCQMCRGHSFNGTWTESGVETCRKAFMEAFTYADDTIIEGIGLRHPRLGQMTVRANAGSPMQVRHARLSRCMPSFLVVGTQKGGTSSLHYMLKSGWHTGIAVNDGEKEIHYFSFDDNYAKGPTAYQQRWDGPDAVLGECSTHGKLRGEVSATYFDYPRAAERAAALLPLAKMLFLLREPVSRVLSSFNMRWQIEICGKLTWTRPDCYKAITSRDVVRANAVGPFQRAAALKVWGRCSDGKGLRTECLRGDFVAKLHNRTRAEMAKLDDCAKQSGAEGLGGCLGIRTLSQRKLYKQMEDSSYIYRSIYFEHLQGWLKFYPPSQLLVLPSEALFDDHMRLAAMKAFATFLGLAPDGPGVNPKVLSAPSPAATDGSPHENGRDYVVVSAPDDIAASLRQWLCPRNQQLAKLLIRHQLTPSAETLGLERSSAGYTMPWLSDALSQCDLKK